MSTTLKNGIIIPDNGSRNWGGDLANNWNILDLHVGYMNDVKIKVTTLENSVAENTANIEINASNISALQTSKQDVIEDLETIRAGASAGATAVQPSALSDYLPLSGGAITGNIENRSDADGWKAGIEWFYNNKRFAYIHAFTEEARSEKSLTIQADTHINLISQNLIFSVVRSYGGNTYQNALNFQCETDGTFNFYGDTLANLGTPANKWKDVNTNLLNGKTPAYAYNTTSVISNLHVGSVLTGNAKNVAFVLPLNVDGSPTIAFDKLIIRGNGNYLFGSTSNSNVTTSYTFSTTIVNGGMIVVLTFSDAETKVPNNSCVATHVVVRLTY